MAEKPHLLPHLSRRARFERLEAGAPPRTEPDFDLTLAQPQAAQIRGLDPAWLVGFSDQPYRPDCRGTSSARQALCTFFSHRTSLDEDDLLLTASTSEAYAFLLLTLCDPGDAILVPSPGYPLLDDIAQLLSIRLVTYSLRYDGSWFIDASTLPDRRQIENDKIRAIVVISPHHPTGHVLSVGELSHLADCGLPLIVDEVFAPYVMDTCATDCEPLTINDESPLCLVVGGLSKSVAAPGLKLGWIVGRGRGAREFLSELEFVSDVFLSVNQLVQEGLPQILSQAESIQHNIRERLLFNRATALRICRDGALSALLTRSGWSMILRLPEIAEEAEWCCWALDVGVKLQPGRLYSLPFAASFVVSLLTEIEAFEAALLRLIELVKLHTETQFRRSGESCDAAGAAPD